ncbi:MAG: glycosyltransferase [Desulfobacterales bacterium]|nr:glycosyltransferase [Desulfobacterales bacterium]
MAHTRVLHIETGRHLYGGALQVFYLLKGLRRENCRNALVCAAGSEIGRVAAPFAPVYEAPMAGDVDPRLPVRLWRIIQREKPDIIHVHARRGADVWGGLAARLAGIPCVITRRVDNPEPPWLARIKYRFYRRIITISHGIERVLVSEGVPRKKITRIPSAVDPAPYEAPRDMDFFFKEFDLTGENTAIGVIAQLIPRKGHRFLIEAAPEILRKYPGTRFLFFGQGPMERTLRQHCEAHGVAGAVSFCGFRKDLPRILPCLDLVVHPALMEGLGVSLLQASAAGVPIVAARAGGVPEVVRDGVNGRIVPPGDVSALTAATLDLLRDPDRARALGRAGRKLVRSEFSIESMVNGYLDVYRETRLIPARA